MHIEIRKFKKEIEALKKLAQADGLVLSSKQAEVIKQKVLAQAALTEISKPVFGSKIFRLSVVFRYASVLVLGVFFVGTTALAANASVPGDWLYGVKRVKEKLELQTAFSPEHKARVQVKQAEERLEELRQILVREEDELVQPEAVISPATTTPKVVGQLPTATQAVILSPSGTIRSLNNQKNRYKARAQEDAEKAVQAALGSLRLMQQELEAQGHGSSAQILDNDISHLENRAKAQGLNFKQQKQTLQEDREQEKDNKESQNELQNQREDR